MTKEDQNNQPKEDNSKWQQKHPSQTSEKDAKNQPEPDFISEIADLKDKNLRLLAEIDNLRRRSKEDLEKAAKYSIANFVGDLVVTIENFFLANSHSPREEIAKSEAIKNYAQAIDMTQKELVKILEKHNVKRIYPLQNKFDHNFHEALSQIESEEEEGTVIQVIQAGYQIGDRLLRPALVGVAKKKN